MSPIRIVRGRIRVGLGINVKEYGFEMKASFHLIFPIIFLQTLLASCSSLDSTPPLSFEDGYLNQQILLRAPDFSNTFRTTDVISLELKYNSNNAIVLPNNYNLKIFERTSESWVEIKEKPIERLPAGDIILSPTKLMPAVEVIFFSPNLDNPETKNQLRIYVTGDMITNEGIKKVAAYVDITLYP